MPIKLVPTILGNQWPEIVFYYCQLSIENGDIRTDVTDAPLPKCMFLGVSRLIVKSVCDNFCQTISKYGKKHSADLEEIGFRSL